MTEDRPLAKNTALPPRYSTFNVFWKSAVILTFVLESYQPYGVPQADQDALWRFLLRWELPFRVGIPPHPHHQNRGPAPVTLL